MMLLQEFDVLHSFLDQTVFFHATGQGLSISAISICHFATLLLTFLLSYGTAMRFWLGLTLSLFTLQTIASILSQLYLLGCLAH